MVAREYWTYNNEDDDRTNVDLALLATYTPVPIHTNPPPADFAGQCQQTAVFTLIR